MRFSKLVKEAFNDDPRFLTSRDKVVNILASITIITTTVMLHSYFICRVTALVVDKITAKVNLLQFCLTVLAFKVKNKWGVNC